MTNLEALDVLMVLRAGLPGAYLKLTEADTAAMVSLWAEMFADYPGDMVAAAAKTYIWNDKTGRFPTPGTIREEIESIQKVTSRCAHGITVQEYMGEASKRFPPPVIAYIGEAASQRHMELYGAPLNTQAEKIDAHRMMPLGGG